MNVVQHMKTDITIDRLATLFRQGIGKKIAVLGDVMLDRYFWGNVHRISPEAPVPVVDVEHETVHLGGASNVAVNLKSLGAEPLMIGVVGDDNSGKVLREIVREAQMNDTGIITATDRPTTVKTRIIGNNQQIARLDREVSSSLPLHTEELVVNVVREHLDSLDGIIIEDYNKGVITHQLIREVVTLARSKNIPVFVDPKYNNFFEYQFVTLFKPNRKETQDALNIQLATDDDILRAGNELLKRLNAENVLITLGARGMMLFEKSGTVSSVPTHARNVADVSGAGDTAIATLAFAFTAGASMTESVVLANYAAGVVCEEPGIIAISQQRLRETLTRS
jgi:rfaE bifunctional protein kinase chain/domain